VGPEDVVANPLYAELAGAASRHIDERTADPQTLRRGPHRNVCVALGLTMLRDPRGSDETTRLLQAPRVDRQVVDVRPPLQQLTGGPAHHLVELSSGRAREPAAAFPAGPV